MNKLHTESTEKELNLEKDTAFKRHLTKNKLWLLVKYLPNLDKYYLISQNGKMDSRKQNKYYKSNEVNDAVLKYYLYLLAKQY